MEAVKELINRRRRQVIIHSIIYYRFGDSIVSDCQFDQWAYELVELQKKYPKVAKECEHAETFKDFDGTTGYDLDVLGCPVLMSKANYILEITREIESSKRG